MPAARPVSVKLVAVTVAALTWLSLIYNPRAAAAVEAQKQRALQIGSYAALRAGEFRSFDSGRLVLYANQVTSDGELQGIFADRMSGDQEIARGIHLFETPGHTLGHYSLMVELSGRRPMLFTGDACYSAKGLDMMAMPSSHVDPVKGYRSIERLKELAITHDAEIFFAHDAENYGHYLKAPYWYA